MTETERRLRLALTFAKAVLRSGERWTERHEDALRQIEDGTISNRPLTEAEAAQGEALAARAGWLVEPPPGAGAEDAGVSGDT